MSNNKAKEIAEKTATMVNCLFDPKEVCEELAKEHRTLQQSFTRLCIAWIQTCASDDYRFDGRNEASHIVCKEVSKRMSDVPYWDSIPLI